MEHLYNYSLEELTEYFKSINEKPFRAKQVFQWLYQKNAFDFQEMSNISKDLREKLEEGIKDSEHGNVHSVEETFKEIEKILEN